jgi:dCMP deaminase
MKDNLKWHKRFLNVAKEVSTWSKDPSSKIGAVIVGNKSQIISQGYNGFPRGIKDLINRLNTRETKYKFVVHAEMNAIYNAIYNGASIDDCIIYVYGLPTCYECAKAIIQCGISHVINVKMNDGPWTESGKLAQEMFKEAKIKYTLIEI